MSESYPPIRRFVTGHDANNVAKVIMQGPATNAKHPNAGTVSTLIWSTDRKPADIAVGAHLSRRSRADALDAAAEVASTVGLGDLLGRPAASLTVAGRKRLLVAQMLRLASVPSLIHEVTDSVASALDAADNLRIGSAAGRDRSSAVAQALRLLDQASYRLIRNPDDLLEAVCEVLRLVECDVAAFESLVATGSEEALVQAAKLYRGDFLDGFAISEERFDQWVLAERDRLHRMSLRAHMQLLEMQSRRGAVDEAISTAQHSLRIDILQEPVHRSLMRLYMQSGDLVNALQQFETCAKVLKRELRIDPDAETRSLYLYGNINSITEHPI